LSLNGISDFLYWSSIQPERFFNSGIPTTPGVIDFTFGFEGIKIFLDGFITEINTLSFQIGFNVGYAKIGMRVTNNVFIDFVFDVFDFGYLIKLIVYCFSFVYPLRG